MASIAQQILTCILDNWHKDLHGVSALSVAEQLAIPHEQVLETFDSLEEQGKGHLRRDVTLHPISMINTEAEWKFEYEAPVNTAIFFPAKELLEEDFFNRQLDRENLPEYIVRLQKGASQIQLFYFDSEVLRKYLDHPEIYEVENTVADGSIHHRSSYISALSSEELERLNGIFIRFGKRKLSSDSVAIAVIVHDLAELPVAEQRYWHSFEINELEFSSNDPDFEIYWGQSVEAEFLDDNDPLIQALDEIGTINRLLGKNLYSQESNAYLSYPVVNTYDKFCDSCSELYKLVGPDNLVENSIKDLLVTHYGYSQSDFIHKDPPNRPIGKLDLFKRLCKAMNLSAFADVIDEVQKHRVSADHKILTPELPNQNYIAEFRYLTQRLGDNLTAFRGELERLKPLTNG